ncbi:MAG: hypothetical protein K9G58_09910 [Bacteroidales bacterium]|nr:hypothetical protein [Bacteroidales bacterium]MCF8388534.1 hypothetical protein [Bacteroidales bacterium]MCF8398474.1 hypothetical protein [Bacteroidales bacterium]
MEFSVGGQWGWVGHAAPQIFNEFANQDPCNILGGTWPATFGPGSDQFPGRDSYDFTFALYGNEVEQAPLSDWPIYLGVFLILAFTVIRVKKLYKKQQSKI